MYKIAALLAVLAGPSFATSLEIDVAGEANGTIVIALRDDIAPLHVAQIVALAEAGAYDGVVFHRVIEGFMAQTGDVQFGRAGSDLSAAGTGGSDLPDLPAEFSDATFARGTVGMARAGDPRCGGDPTCEAPEFLNSANSQFFIMFGPGEFLDGGYTIVGEVTSGLDVLDAIKRGEGQSGAVSGTPDVMVDVRVVE